MLGPLDEHLLIEGAHRQLYLRLGAHFARHEGVDGVAFAVWAPNARRVSVVGDFNRWDGRRSQMRKRLDSGLWEIFVPGLGAGAVYGTHGWAGVCLLGAGLGLLTLAMSAYDRLRPPSRAQASSTISSPLPS